MKWVMVGCAVIDAAFAGKYLALGQVIPGVFFVALSVYCSLVYIRLSALEDETRAPR